MTPAQQGGSAIPPPVLYLGTHEPYWLARVDFPLCVAAQRLARIKGKLPRAKSPWILDSGGFSVLRRLGRWPFTAEQYVRTVARYQREIGNLVWAAPMDWMTEWQVIHGGILNGMRFVGTGLSAEEHQRRTVDNYVLLAELWPQYSDGPSPFIPVLQGDSIRAYLRCSYLYSQAGVRFTDMRVTGVGSVCRLQGTAPMADLFRAVGICGRVHGFGVKTQGVLAYWPRLASIDSTAWSLDAYRRKAPFFPGCTHQTCSNCLVYATWWRSRLLAKMASNYQAQTGAPVPDGAPAVCEEWRGWRVGGCHEPAVAIRAGRGICAAHLREREEIAREVHDRQARARAGQAA